jgi:hypothetical protein
MPCLVGLPGDHHDVVCPKAGEMQNGELATTANSPFGVLDGYLARAWLTCRVGSCALRKRRACSTTSLTCSGESFQG